MDLRPHHVALSVASVEASKSFYARLGFKPYSTWVAADESFRIATLQHATGLMLELFEYHENRDKPPVTYSIGNDLEVRGLKHLALRVANVQSSRETLIKAGYKDLTEIAHAEIDYFFIRDPDGLWVELVQDDRGPHEAAATSCCGLPVPHDVARRRQETL